MVIWVEQCRIFAQSKKVDVFIVFLEIISLYHSLGSIIGLKKYRFAFIGSIVAECKKIMTQYNKLWICQNVRII